MTPGAKRCTKIQFGLSSSVLYSSVWARLPPCTRPHVREPAPKSEHFASRRDLCGAVPGRATVFLWTASRRSYSTRRSHLGRAGLCQRSIHSSCRLAKRRIRTLASVTQCHRKRLSHQDSRARSQELRRSSAMRRHRKPSSRLRAQPTLQRVPRKRRLNKAERVRAGLQRAKREGKRLGRPPTRTSWLSVSERLCRAA